MERGLWRWNKIFFFVALLTEMLIKEYVWFRRWCHSRHISPSLSVGRLPRAFMQRTVHCRFCLIGRSRGSPSALSGTLYPALHYKTLYGVNISSWDVTEEFQYASLYYSRQTLLLDDELLEYERNSVHDTLNILFQHHIPVVIYLNSSLAYHHYVCLPPS